MEYDPPMRREFVSDGPHWNRPGHTPDDELDLPTQYEFWLPHITLSEFCECCGDYPFWVEHPKQDDVAGVWIYQGEMQHFFDVLVLWVTNQAIPSGDGSGCYFLDKGSRHNPELMNPHYLGECEFKWCAAPKPHQAFTNGCTYFGANS